MLMRKELLSSAGGSGVMATSAGLVVTMGEPPLAIAGPVAPASKGVSATTASSDATDFSARRRYYRRGGSAAGLAWDAGSCLRKCCRSMDRRTAILHDGSDTNG